MDSPSPSRPLEMTWLDIHTLQIELQVTKEELAKLIGVSTPTLSGWMRRPDDPRHRKPRPIYAEKILSMIKEQRIKSDEATDASKAPPAPKITLSDLIAGVLPKSPPAPPSHSLISGFFAGIRLPGINPPPPQPSLSVMALHNTPDALSWRLGDDLVKAYTDQSVA